MRQPAIALVRLDPACAREGIRLTIVGDSLARGWGASAPKYAFASLVFADVKNASPKATMRNLGIPGATTDEIVAKEVPQIRATDCAIIVIISGANDVQKLHTPHHFGTSYAMLLQQIRKQLPQAALVVMGLPDVSLSPIIPWPLKPLESWLSKDGDAAIGAVAPEYGAAFVPLYALSRREAYREGSLLSGDGIHPNDSGYRIMADAALPSISEVARARLLGLHLQAMERGSRPSPRLARRL
jgi:lysophospholipase L1-like esterase